MLNTKIVFIGFLFVLLSCSRETVWIDYKISGSAMGTQWRVTLVSDKDKIDYVPIKRDIIEEIEEIEQLMSHYRPNSEISTLNNNPAGGWYSISQPLYDVLELSRNIGEKTFGAFDVTLGAVVNEWGFGSTKDSINALPDNQKLKELLANAGWNKYHLDIDAGVPRLGKTGDFNLDLSAIAKGYAVDRVAELLISKGITNFLVDIGGEIKTNGHNASKQKWLVAIEKPIIGSSNTAQELVRLSNKAIATSGNYRNFQKINGENYTHIINHRTGKPVKSNILSVSVISNSAAKADAWATALMNMPPDASISHSNIENIPVLLVIKNENGIEETKMSSSFKAYLDE